MCNQRKRGEESNKTPVLMKSMLFRQKEKYSEVFFVRYRQHIIYVFTKILVTLSFSGAVTAVSWLYIVRGNGSVLLTSIATAIFLWLGWGSCVGIVEILRVRLLPYFERQVDGPETWLSGESLLWHSRQLDDLAKKFEVKPLSSFASGDDMVPFEQVCWFSSDEGLRTAERLTQLDVTSVLPDEVISDLVKLRNALRVSSVKGVRFCLLLREGTSASGAEMSQRQGSFF